ncbi:MAG TPA: YCF48-related protein, partial [Ignavibacteriaceae bacterium]
MKSIIQLLVYTIILSGILSVSHSQRSSWLKINSPVNTNLRNLFFADSLTGWASGASGRIINTTDGGVSWNIQNSNVASFVTDIFFLNENFGWAITVKDQSPFNTVILKTTNGGNEWITEDFYDMNAFMTTIFFLDSLNGFIGGSYISKTTNGGSTWEKATIDSSMFSTRPIFKFRFYNKNFGYACGGATDQAGVIWRTTNGGLNWSAQGLGPDEIFDLFIIDSLNAISLSGDPEEFYPTGNIKTTNAGETWTYEELPFYSLSFAID